MKVSTYIHCIFCINYLVVKRICSLLWWQ